ncbi:hypothetical protein NPX13_g2811 [Xylaria arbuscula]|uniref:HhH-GPD domain-containing protein n=1 Tax=Xylaria arbuscula TaxID=114810 RepID=A0A9W8NIY4_9PEZI|nr:hypothetical protein NPX13_g2811 [Xylaria arbuscula]
MVRRSARLRRNEVPVRGQWEILPHGMGVRRAPASEPMKHSKPTKEVLVPKSINNEGDNTRPEPNKSKEETIEALVPDDNHIHGMQLSRSTANMVENTTQYPLESTASQEHENPQLGIKTEFESDDLIVTIRRSTRIRARAKASDNCDAALRAEELVPKETKAITIKVKRKADALNLKDLSEKPKRVPRKTKDNPYGLTPGRSPFPDWQAPSPSQCEEVYQILADIHGEIKQPATIPAPSLEVAGCGEVPSVLDALLRTLLSGAVTFSGADSMVKAIIQKYGIVDDELAAGSINWNKVRLSSVEELEETIHIGGLAKRKSTHIKGILDLVYQDNHQRREAYLTEKATGVPANVYGAAQKTQSQKDLEILKTERNILSLDHLHGLSSDEAMKQFTKFPGIGVKTAACVILFCLQQPCFAVDTHVHRFSRWLGWTPAKADENDTFSHLEVRCPDHLKYSLHQLFIHHGKHCGRCKMSTVEGTKDWEAIVCPIDHLLTRGKRMTKMQNLSKKAAKTEGKGAPSHQDEVDAELSDASTLILSDEQHN